MPKRYPNQTRDNPFSRMWNSEVKLAMGCDPNKHWPDEGVSTRPVNGVLVQVTPKTGKGQGRRCVALCPCCHVWVCVGHYGQHIAGANHQSLSQEPGKVYT